jgi:outer membrane protein OmpA-like peptidoglycan-associated protein
VAQNLVPNGSFEKFSRCPNSFSQLPSDFTINEWQATGKNIPDHFHYCSRGDASVPYNWAGIAEAYEGDGYAGIYLWSEEGSYRDFLQCQLLQPLIKDSTYYIEFHYKLSSYSGYAIDRIALHFSDKSELKIEGISPTLSVKRDSAVTKNTGLWEAARFEYQAIGDEKFLTIGNLFSDMDTRNFRLRTASISEAMLVRSAYYYIDAVIVVPKYRIRAQLASNIGEAFSIQKSAFNTPYILKHIQFDFNSATLQNTSFNELNSLVDFLMEHKEIRVEISGHTDNIGEDEYNNQLSRYRAESVTGYLIEKGVDENRFQTFGYGKSQPLVQGNSEDSRKINRRVEVRFIQ